MEMIINIKQEKKSALILDRKSDRFKICPKCHVEHMVAHRGRDFCSDKCCDDYNNEKKRLLKQSEVVVPQLEIIMPDALLPHLEDIMTNVTSNDDTIPKTESISPPNQWQIQFDSNINILDTLTIHATEGSHFYIENLVQRGFNFFMYSDQGKLHNLPAGHKCQYLTFGKFQIYLLDHGKVLIVKK